MQGERQRGVSAPVDSLSRGAHDERIIAGRPAAAEVH